MTPNSISGSPAASTAVTAGPAIAGIHGVAVRVEATIRPGPPTFVLSGLDDTIAQPMRERVRAAIINAGLPWPQGTITVEVGLQPGWHSGSALDLAVAMAILAASGNAPASDGTLFIGELGLDGRVRRVRATLPMALAATPVSLPNVVFPHGNLAELHAMPGVHLRAVRHLREAIGPPAAATRPPRPAPHIHRNLVPTPCGDS